MPSHARQGLYQRCQQLRFINGQSPVQALYWIRPHEPAIAIWLVEGQVATSAVQNKEEPAPSRCRLFVYNAVLIPDELLVWLVRPLPSMTRHYRRSLLDWVYGEVTLAAQVRMPACSTVLIRLVAFSEAAVSFIQRR